MSDLSTWIVRVVGLVWVGRSLLMEETEAFWVWWEGEARVWFGRGCGFVEVEGVRKWEKAK